MKLEHNDHKTLGDEQGLSKVATCRRKSPPYLVSIGRLLCLAFFTDGVF